MQRRQRACGEDSAGQCGTARTAHVPRQHGDAAASWRTPGAPRELALPHHCAFVSPSIITVPQGCDNDCSESDLYFCVLLLYKENRKRGRRFR